MPVYKFKSFEEAGRALWSFSPDARYYARIRALFRFGDRLRPARGVRGVQKFRSFEDADSARSRAIF